MAARLVFGGAYGNLPALEALLEWAARRGVGAAEMVFTGDIAAYCADGAATAELMRRELTGADGKGGESGVGGVGGAVMVRGNCERALAEDAEDCGCGFAPDSACAVLSDAWFRHARRTIAPELKRWMGALPLRAEFVFAGRRIVVTHADSESDNGFVFPSTPAAELRRHLRALNAEAVVCGHSGIPFARVLDGKYLWHNSGALGMPANDGTSRTWFSLWEEQGTGIRIRRIPLAYNCAATAEAMQRAGLPRGYRECLTSGIWPSDSVLPPAEKARQGRPLAAEDFVWR